LFSPHPSSALEYWFFKVNLGPVALLVDWIVRRRSNENLMRVSIHTPGKREVLFEQQSGFMPGNNFLSTKRTIGHLGDVAWELEIDAGRDWIKPDIFPAGFLNMPDLKLVSSPLATFTGWIRYGGQLTTLKNAPGIISHYWGRQLPSEWWWVSASQFDQPEVAVECSVLRSGLWGTRMQFPLAYLYLCLPGSRKLVMAPFNFASVKGSPENFEVEIRRIGAKTVTLTCVGRDYGDFGDGIINTLVGDLEIRLDNKLIARADGTAAFEHRSPIKAFQKTTIPAG
jgi:hypothetical protein